MRSLLYLTLLLGFSFPAIAQTKTYKIYVSAESYRNYVLNETDRNGSVSGNDPTVPVINEIRLFLLLMHHFILSM